MVSDLLPHFEFAAVLQISRDPGRAESMIANPRFDAGRFRATKYKIKRYGLVGFNETTADTNRR